MAGGCVRAEATVYLVLLLLAAEALAIYTISATSGQPLQTIQDLHRDAVVLMIYGTASLLTAMAGLARVLDLAFGCGHGHGAYDLALVVTTTYVVVYVPAALHFAGVDLFPGLFPTK